MRAYYLHGARDLREEQVEVPPLDANQVLVRLRAAGICGSDMHYYAHGSNSGFDVKVPFVLGHEFAGEVADAGNHADRLPVGTRVAVDPSQPCRLCRYCVEGTYNLCTHMKYFGSAALVPHIDGCFREFVPALAERCHIVPEGLSWGEAALLEPLSVVLHAATRAGNLAGQRVLISGAGPIGQLLGLVTKHHGAASIAVTDVRSEALKLASELWADHTVLADSTEDMDAVAKLCGGFDIVIEASGAAPALRTAYERCNAGGVIVQLGTQIGDVSVPANLALLKELTIRGSFRFAHQFGRALDLLARRKLNVQPLITNTFPLSALPEAFDTALGAASVKVVLENDL
jgi:L-idonate 5-dehydrogenase